MSDEIDFNQPVDEGDEVVVDIEDVGSKGDGIARIKGFVIFVPETDIGETVRVEVENIGSKFAFAKVIERDVDGEFGPDDEVFESEQDEDNEFEEEPEEKGYYD